MDNHGKLPEFQKPPINEVVIGIQFEPKESWSTAHFGEYWAGIKKEYPFSDIKPPVIPQIEVFGDANRRFHQQDFQLNDNVRCWFSSVDKARIIQVQQDRFMVNWKRNSPDEEYPRYKKFIRPAFVKEYGRFLDYLRGNGMNELNVTQCEISYVNVIPRGKAWESFKDLSKLVSPWSGQMNNGFLSEPETVNLMAAFAMPGEKGRLRISVQHAFLMKDQTEAIQITLLARGKPASSGTDDILKWCDEGHEWIVRGFSDITSKESHDLWARKDDKP